jgi:serine/threonine-protein kinase RsbW
MLTLENPKQVIDTVKDQPGNNDLWLNINTTQLGISHFDEFADFMKRVWNIDDTSFLNIYTASSEALMNAADHGNNWEEDKQIHIHAHRDREHFIISIKDEGEGFNYKRIANPTDIENRTKVGGRGIFIMKYLADKIRYSEFGSCVELSFRNTAQF